jgi:hypothetical protein
MRSNATLQGNAAAGKPCKRHDNSHQSPPAMHPASCPLQAPMEPAAYSCPQPHFRCSLPAQSQRS